MEKGKVTGQNPEIVGRKDQSCAQSIIDGFLCILMYERRDLKLSTNYDGRGSEAKTLICHLPHFKTGTSLLSFYVSGPVFGAKERKLRHAISSRESKV